MQDFYGTIEIDGFSCVSGLYMSLHTGYGWVYVQDIMKMQQIILNLIIHSDS